MVYKGVTQKMTEFHTQWFSVGLNTISHFRAISIFKNFIEQKLPNPYPLLCQTSFVEVQRFMR
jgi:hypothetical protein